MLSKRDHHNLKKTKENKSENKSKNALHTGQFHLDKRSTKKIKYDKEELQSLFNSFGINNDHILQKTQCFL